MTGTVHLDVADRLATITFSNEGRLNALDHPLVWGIAEALEKLAAGDKVNVVLLRGAGDAAFSAGVDIKAAREVADQRAYFAEIDAAMTAIAETLKKLQAVSIALISGVCYGGGVQLATMADFRIISASAKLCIPAIRNGLVYPESALANLAALAGTQMAKRLIFEGAVLEADEIRHCGLADHLFPIDSYEPRAGEIAARMAAAPRDLLKTYLRMFDR